MAESLSDHQAALAEQRTEAAIYRTLLAEERTYSAWLRTGLASVATGFAIAKWLTDAGPAIYIDGLASVFVLAGAMMFLLSFWAYRDGLKRLAKPSTGGMRLWVLGLLSLLLFVASLAGLLLLIPMI